MKKLITITGICCALALPALAGPGADGDKKGKPGGPAGAGGKGKGGKRPDAAQVFQHLDADKSGGISLEEYKNGPMAKRAKDPSMVEQRFGRIDADSDGNITKAEMTEAFKKMAGQRGQRGKGAGPGGGKKRPGSDDT